MPDSQGEHTWQAWQGTRVQYGGSSRETTSFLHASVSLSGLKGHWEPGSIWEEFAELWIKREQLNYSPSTEYKTQGPKEGRN